jgi:hypothetical protein
MVAHTYNTSYSGVKNRGTAVQGHLEKNIARPYLKTGPTWWYMPVIPATQEV